LLLIIKKIKKKLNEEVSELVKRKKLTRCN